MSQRKLNKSMHRLWGMRCYLVGAMDKAPDRGAVWRDKMTPFLKKLGVIVLNPCDKPIDIGLENVENQEYRRKLKNTLQLDTLSREVRLLRSVDLRMCDISDFLIVNIDTDIHACGTYEEITTANREKKPILIHCEQGIIGLPDWIFGMLPSQFFFGSWEHLKEYLYDIHTLETVDNLKRWMFFDYSQMLPKITAEESELLPEDLYLFERIKHERH